MQVAVAEVDIRRGMLLLRPNLLVLGGQVRLSISSIQSWLWWYTRSVRPAIAQELGQFPMHICPKLQQIVLQQLEVLDLYKCRAEHSNSIGREIAFSRGYCCYRCHVLFISTQVLSSYIWKAQLSLSNLKRRQKPPWHVFSCATLQIRMGLA